MSLPPFHGYMGFEIERLDEGEVVVTLELAEHHRNKRGVVHGGVISSLLDTALGAAVVSSIPAEWWCATISLSIQFLEGARSGKLTGTGRVIRKGRRVAFAEGDVVDDRGRRVATAEGSWHLWSHHPGRPDRAESEPFVVLAGREGRRLLVGKILAVGRNYADHNVEMGYARTDPPIIFGKP
ncbi:MAG: hotdog fold thioesterase, partial [Acidobacteriota bacterium]|nr:hotdog fold thioesterase [Acidobacteriota bacterium]